jgi:hypothetical protein
VHTLLLELAKSVVLFARRAMNLTMEIEVFPELLKRGSTTSTVREEV